MNTSSSFLAFDSRRRSARAFTLVELLVVIGVIATLAGVLIGVLGGGGNSATALQSAQTTMSGLLAAARGQAALTGYNAALFVNDNDNPQNTDRYLRYCVIAVYQPVSAGSATYSWVAANDGVYLPKGAYIVSPDANSHAVAGVSFPLKVTTASGGFDGTISSLALNSSTQEQWLVLGISPLGGRVDATAVTATASPSATAVGYLAVSTADPQPPGSQSPILFTNAQNIRGMSISQYGVAGFINDASGFN